MIPSSQISNVTAKRIAPGIFAAQDAYSGTPNFFKLSPLLNANRGKYSIRKLSTGEMKQMLPALVALTGNNKYVHLKDAKVHHLFIAEHNGKPVGYAGLTCFHGYWCLRVCFVSPKHRGHGLQKKLIDARAEYVRENYPKAKHINVWISPENTYSIRNVQAAGFVLTKDKPRVYNGVECRKYRLAIR